MSKGNRKKLRRRRAVVLSGIFLIIAALILTGVWAVFNCSESYIERVVSSSVNGTLSIGDMSFSYPFKLDISKISLDLPDNTHIAADHLFADINIAALIRRNISINSLLLENPVFSKNTDTQKVHGPAKQTGSGSIKTKSDKPFPWKLNLSDISIASCGLSFPLAQDSSILSLAGISLNVTEVHTKSSNDMPLNLTGKALISADSGFVTYKTGDILMRFRLNSRISLILTPDMNIDLSGFISLLPKNSDTGLTLKAAGNSGPHTVQIDTLSLSMGAARVIQASGLVVHSSGTPASYDIFVDGDAVDIETVQELAARAADLSLPAAFSGTLLPIQGRICGTGSRPGVHLSLGVRNLRAAYTQTAGTCRELNIIAHLDSMETNQEIKGYADINVQDVDMLLPDSSSLSISGATAVVTAGLDTAFRPQTAEILGRIDSLFSGTIFLTGKADKVYDPVSSRAVFTLTADSLALHQIGQNFPVLGTASIRTDITASGYKTFGIGLSASSPGFVLLLPADTLTIPRITTDIGLQASASNNGTWEISRGTIDALGSIHIPFSARISPSLASVSVHNAAVDLSPLYTLFQDIDGLDRPDFSISGKASVDLQVSQKDTIVNGSGAIHLENTRCSIPQDSLLFQDIQSRISFDFDRKSAVLSGHVSCDTIHISRIRPEPVTGSVLRFRAGITPDTTRIDTLTLSIDNDLVTGGLSGYTGNNSYAARCLVNFQADSCSSGMGAMQTRGTASVSGSVISKNGTIDVTGEALSDSFYISLGPSINIENMSMNVPFSLNIDSGVPVDKTESVQTVGSGFPDYTTFRTVYLQRCPEIGMIQADSISIKNLAVTEPVIDIIVRDGTVQIPFFGASLMRGTVGGSLVISAGSMSRESVSYIVNGQFSDIDASYFSGVGGGKNTIINATASITGRGIDPEKGIDMNGYFSISDMGSEVASALLKGIDPSGTDKSIKITQRLIRTGWKPLLFSFDLKHGYMYPSLSLSQPWFSPIRIPDNLEYGRIPVAFFIENMKTNKEEPGYEK